MKKAISILLLTVITTVCIAQSQEYSFSEKYNIESQAQLSVDLVEGDISVYASDEPDISVNFIAKINKQLIKIDRKELEKYYTIEIKKTQNSISIYSRPTQMESNKKWSKRLILSFEVMVPNTTSCALHTVDGNISVSDLQANQTCKTDDGNIYLSGIKGTVSATTDDGNLRFNEIEGELTAISHDGDMRGSLSVLTDIISVTTRDGDIKVTLPKGLGLNLNLKADEINTGFTNFNGKVDKNHILGKLNGGGIPVNISTSDGDLRLDFI